MPEESVTQKKLRLMFQEETAGMTSGNLNEVCSKLAGRFRLSQEEIRQEVIRLDGQFRDMSQRTVWLRRQPPRP